jgi:hypothetical protein
MWGRPCPGCSFISPLLKDDPGSIWLGNRKRINPGTELHSCKGMPGGTACRDMSRPAGVANR